MSMLRRRSLVACWILCLAVVGAGAASTPAIPSPAEFFGFEIGSDESLARWDRIVEYFDLIAAQSDRVRIDRLGPTTLDNEFITVVISSPANLAAATSRTADYQRLQKGQLSDAEARALADSAPVRVMITHNIHSTEIGASQTSIRLVHELATADDSLTREILDNVILVLLPSANPDGQIMVTDWYRENLGTDFEEAPMPWLYHAFAGHDNNRDFTYGNLVETRYMFDLWFRQWIPQVYLDQHQMGSTGPRIFVPPFPDPQSPDIPPLMYQQMRSIGGAIVTDLAAADKGGVLTGEMYRIYGQEGALSQRFHNMIGLLTETASARIASPVEVTAEELQRASRQRQGRDYEFSVAMVDPWEAGTWRLGDIVEYQTIAARATLKHAARFRADLLYNQHLMALESRRRANTEGPYAWLIRPDQRDPVQAADLVERLLLQGVEVHRARDAFDALVPDPVDPWAPAPMDVETEGDADAAPDADNGSEEGDDASVEEEQDDSEARDSDGEGDDTVEPPMAGTERTFPAGTYVVLGAQSARPALIDVLDVRAPAAQETYPGGPYLRRYDSAAYTMPILMGVEVTRVEAQFDAAIEPVANATVPAAATAPNARTSYAFSAAVNRSYELANRLLRDGVAVRRATAPILLGSTEAGPGTFVVGAADGPALARHAEDLGVEIFADPTALDGMATTALGAARIGLYKPWTASMDEGWTRYVLEDYGFAYENLDNAAIRAGDLGERVDVIIVPGQIGLRRIMEGISADDAPEPYAGGIGEEGVEALRAFVNSGGTLLTLDSSDALAIEHFDVPVRNSLEGLSGRDFFYSPSILHIDVDARHPLGYGMPERAGAFFGGGRAYEPDGWDAADGSLKVVAGYPSEGRVLASGLLVGDEHLAGRAAVVEATYGRGRIVLYGFRVQHRAQTHGTFKLLFNALYR